MSIQRINEAFQRFEIRCPLNIDQIHLFDEIRCHLIEIAGKPKLVLNEELSVPEICKYLTTCSNASLKVIKEKVDKEFSIQPKTLSESLCKNEICEKNVECSKNDSCKEFSSKGIPSGFISIREFCESTLLCSRSWLSDFLHLHSGRPEDFCYKLNRKWYVQKELLLDVLANCQDFPVISRKTQQYLKNISA